MSESQYKCNGIHPSCDPTAGDVNVNMMLHVLMRKASTVRSY
jgi:hypothetical protein